MKTRLMSTVYLATMIGFASTMLGCASTNKSETVGQYVDDSAITTKVKAKLLADPVTSAMRVSVETYKGIVLLSGFVNSRQEKQKADDIAKAVGDVRAVRNELFVKDQA